MRRGAAGGDQRGADTHARAACLLQPVQCGQQRFKWAVGQGQCSLVRLVLLKRGKALGLEHLFGLVGKQHCVAVECDTHFVRVGQAGLHRFGQHPRSRKAQAQRFPHIVAVG